jgi:hypothetical protein
MKRAREALNNGQGAQAGGQGASASRVARIKGLRGWMH